MVAQIWVITSEIFFQFLVLCVRYEDFSVRKTESLKIYVPGCRFKKARLTLPAARLARSIFKRPGDGDSGLK